MSATSPGSHQEPRPSAETVRQRLGEELSSGARITYVLLLLVSLGVAGVTGALVATEEGLPLRTTLALGAITVGALCWACLFVWTLTRRKVLLGRHRVVAGRIATVFSAIFTIGSLTIATRVPEMRAAGLGAAAFGAVLVAAAVWIWRRAAHRHARLTARRDDLARRVAGGRAAVWLLVGLSLLAGSLPTVTADAQTLATDGIELRLGSPPAAMAALGRIHLAYELHLTNMGTAPRRVESIAVTDGSEGPELAAWRGDQLDARLAPVGGNTAEPRLLAPGARTVVFLWVALAPGQQAPDSLAHRLVTVAADASDPRTLQVGPTPVAAEPAPPLRPPVEAGRWVAVRAPSNGSVHRRALVTLDGDVHLPTRFAVDWARLGDDGRLYRGQGARNEDWYGYGSPVHAAASGTVTRVIDGIPEHDPRSPDLVRAYERDTVTGNTIVVEQRDGRSAVYAHLQPGSIPVREGEPVEEGDRIGRVGNSGLSLAPHLHFHLVDGPDPMAAEGLPFRLRAFRLIGRIDSLGAAVAGTPWQPDARRPARDVTDEMPMENMVLELDPASDR